MELLTRNLSLIRGDRLRLEGLDLSVASGEILVVLGPNGSGKSTLLLTLAGILRARVGEVHLDGRPIASWSSRQRGRRIAWQGSLPGAEFGFTVRERLDLVDREERRPCDALTRLELDGLADRRLFELSAGERQRVELAALWLREAPIWLLDEPTAHLDLRHQVAWLELLREEAAQGRTSVVVLHDLTQAHAIADQALLLGPEGQHRQGAATRWLQPEELECFFRTRLHVVQGPQESALLPVYNTQTRRRTER